MAILVYGHADKEFTNDGSPKFNFTLSGKGTTDQTVSWTFASEDSWKFYVSIFSDQIEASSR